MSNYIIPIFILIILIKFKTLDGNTNLVNIWTLLAPKVFNILTLSSSTCIKKLWALIIVIITDNDIATTTIPLMPVPAQIIRIGARAVLGKAFKTTKKGSIIFVNVFENHNIIPNNIPINVPIKSPNIVSNKDIVIDVELRKKN